MDNKVVPLFGVRVKTEEQKPDEVLEKVEESFEEVMRKNKDNEERLRKERLNANKSTLRSYNIKP